MYTNKVIQNYYYYYYYYYHNLHTNYKFRNICQQYGFVNNARVTIEYFGKNSITVKTLDKKQISLTLPRIKFKFRAAYGQSYSMIRSQYPLKLGIQYILIFNFI
jgi:hypothetical protein